MNRWFATAGLVIGATALAGCGDTPKQGPAFGLSVPYADPREMTRVGDLVGCRPQLASAFVKLDSDFGPAELGALGAGGRTPLITFEPWSWRSRHGEADAPAYALRRILEGAWDDELIRLGDVLASFDGEVMLRFAHEMNADWYPWGVYVNGNLPAHYVLAWRHVHRMISARAPQVTWVWSPVASWWPGAVPLAELWPGDDVVDVVGVTGYGRENLDATTAQETFGAWYAEVRELTERPLLLAEVGASGPGKRAWIDSLGAFLDAHADIVGFVWFNTAPETTGATGDYRVDDDAADTAAFRSMLASIDPICDDPERMAS